MIMENNVQLFEVEIMSHETGEYRTVIVDAGGLLAIINDCSTEVTCVMYTNGSHAGEYIVTPFTKVTPETTNYLRKFNTIGNYMDNSLYKAAKYLLDNSHNETVRELMERYCQSVVSNFEEYGEFVEPSYEDTMSYDEKLERLMSIHDDTLNKEYTKANEIKYTNLDTLDFTARTYNCLHRANINYLGQLLEMTEQDLNKVRNLGRRSVKEIKDTLHNMDLCLKNEEFDLPDAPEKCKGCEYSRYSWKEQKWVCSLRSEYLENDSICSGNNLESDEDYHGIFADDDDEKYPDGSGKQIFESLNGNPNVAENDELTFSEKVKICAGRHTMASPYCNCTNCPLQTTSVDCFYNESLDHKRAVDSLLDDEDDYDDLQDLPF